MTEWFRRMEVPMARLAIFVVYVWFGLLKLLGLSPAEEMVQALFEKTLSGISFDAFYLALALFEILVGLLFLMKGWEKVALGLIVLHLVMTTLPLILLPAMTWQAALVPTLAGQYIIKNILIVSAAVTVGARRRL